MLVKLTNQALDYAWGSKNLISDYFGLPATGKPMAEIWFGTHDGSPTQVIGQGQSLHELLLQEGKADRLEFLLKILAAEAPLSIQAHPNPEQAVAGFAKENAAGISIAAANRNYKDDRAKPELIVALSESFDALVGFADSRLIIEKLQELLELSQEGALQEKLKSWIEWLAGKDGIRKVFLDSLTDPEITSDLISELVDLAEQLPALVDLVSHLNAHHEGDRGIATALLLNRVTLGRGEAVFVPAGMPHAYLSGLGVEVMLASDNVLRGGLTTKHVDVAELAEVVVFEPVTVELTKSAQLANGLKRFDIPTREFSFYEISLGGQNILADINLPGEAIFLCTAGSVAVSNSLGEREVVMPGEAAFIAKDARTFSLNGTGFGYMVIGSN
ncbi:MAG: hypothetical protein RLZZ556_29 [Actinomycetota bacterium]